MSKRAGVGVSTLPVGEPNGRYLVFGADERRFAFHRLIDELNAEIRANLPSDLSSLLEATACDQEFKFGRNGKCGINSKSRAML